MHRVLVVLIALAGCERGNRDTPPAPQAAEHPATATQARIVTLTPSATEVVAALGATSLLVGVDDYSKFPESVTRLPKVGSFMAPNLEAIVRLHPTLVIVDDIHGEAAGALHDAGITTLECAMHALPDIKSALHTVGTALGRTVQADAAIAAIDTALDDAAAHKPAHHPRVLAVIDREAGGLGNIVAAGPGSWIDELVAVVGGDNVLAAAPVASRRCGRRRQLGQDRDCVAVVEHDDYIGRDRDADRIGPRLLRQRLARKPNCSKGHWRVEPSRLRSDPDGIRTPCDHAGGSSRTRVRRRCCRRRPG